MEVSRIIVKENVSLQQVNALAWTENWYLHDFNPQTEESPYNKIWISQDEQTGIHYIEDFLINIRYFLIEGKTQDEIIKKIRSSIDTYSKEEILIMAKNAVDTKEYIKAIYHLGIIAKNYNAEVFGFFNSGFYHTSIEVRKSAILATVCLGWLEFQEPLQDLQRNDPDANLRQLARKTLESLSINNWQKNGD